jgi:hypothetical protein
VKGGFANIFFLFYPLLKNIYIFIYPKVSFEMYVLKCVKILGKVVKIGVFM